MGNSSRDLLLGGLLLGLVSCGNEGSSPSTTQVPAQNGFNQSEGGAFGDQGKILDRFGASNPAYSKHTDGPAQETQKRGQDQFEGEEFAQKQFAVKDYEKKSFWGSKEYATAVYGGETDGSRFQTASREGGKSAREGFMTSKEAGKAYAVSGYETGAAREAGTSDVTRFSNQRVDTLRETFPNSEVNGHRMSLEESKSWLGN